MRRILIISLFSIIFANVNAIEAKDLENTRWFINVLDNIPDYIFFFEKDKAMEYESITGEYIEGKYEIEHDTIKVELSSKHYISENRSYWSLSKYILRNDKLYFQSRQWGEGRYTSGKKDDYANKIYYIKDTSYNPNIKSDDFLGKWLYHDLVSEEYYIFNSDSTFVYYNGQKKEKYSGNYYYEDLSLVLEETKYETEMRDSFWKCKKEFIFINNKLIPITIRKEDKKGNRIYYNTKFSEEYFFLKEE